MSIVLVGLPGSGKSRLGRFAAEHLSLPFIDLDEAVEATSGRTIPDLFREGEDVFRSLETQALKDALAGPEALIATGGGIVEREENRALLKNRNVVFLDIDLDEAIARASRSESRPLLQGDVKQRMRALSNRRRPLYEQVASVSVKLGQASKEENTRVLLRAIDELVK